MESAMTPGGQTQQAPEQATDTELIPQFHVILLDDNHHSYDYVIEMLMAIFGYDQERAYQMAVIVDTKKRVIVDTTYLERAELRRDQIHAYGPDWRIPGCKGSMSAIVEPAE
jgi:ATP-dependent Clp protease adaptor protein ClpS